MGRLLLAPLLASVAVGMHFYLNVPRKPVVHKQGDQGVTRKRAPPKPRSRDKHAPRDSVELDRLWQEFSDSDFTEEPAVAAWARVHKGLVNKAVVVARRSAFEGAPEQPQVLLATTECRSIRCRFVLRGPFAHEVSMLGDVIESLVAGDEPLWRAYEAVAIEPPDDGSPEGEFYLEVTVAFTSDDTDASTIVMPDEGASGSGSSGDEPGAGHSPQPG